MKDNTVIGLFLIFAIIVLAGLEITTLSEKDEHQKRMELIDEKERLIQLQNSIELRKTMQWVDSVKRVVDLELNEK